MAYKLILIYVVFLSYSKILNFNTLKIVCHVSCNFIQHLSFFICLRIFMNDFPHTFSVSFYQRKRSQFSSAFVMDNKTDATEAIKPQQITTTTTREASKARQR